MNAEITTGISGFEGGGDRPCQIGRLTYRLGALDYVTLAFRYLEPGEKWHLTWHGVEGDRAARLPDGIAPNAEMLEALAVALGETVGLQ